MRWLVSSTPRPSGVLASVNLVTLLATRHQQKRSTVSARRAAGVHRPSRANSFGSRCLSWADISPGRLKLVPLSLREDAHVELLGAQQRGHGGIGSLDTRAC
jgi:hypothetical protein